MNLVSAEAECVWSGGTWLEGPVWIAPQGIVRFSDVPNDRILDHAASTGRTRVYATGVEFANGRAIGPDGCVVQCSQGMRRIEQDHAGVVTSLVDRWEGGRFNSPNDVVVSRDGTVWFTDPPYGLHPSGREGHPGTQDYDGCYVFRYVDGTATPVITDMTQPNGLAFSPDESVLYVSDTGFTWVPGGPRHIRAYDTTTWEGRVFAEPDGIADGLRVDSEGRVWTSASDSVQVYSPDGSLLQTIPLPERVSNLCFGGSDSRTLFVTTRTSLYRLSLAS